MRKKVVITGVNGFVGHHLARELSSQGVSVFGVGRERNPSPKLDNYISEYFCADLTSEWPSIVGPDSIIHLAGFAAVGPSFNDPQKYINGNSSMVTNLCEYYLKQDKKPRIIVISSGAIYDSEQSMPIDELGTIGFNSPYAVSKVLTENQCNYYRSRGLDCIVLRPFNHIGPGQMEGFIIPDLYKQISETRDNTIRVGNLNTRRDYTDVRDIVRAYSKIALAPTLQYDLYNICSGQTLSGNDILSTLKMELGKENIVINIDQSKIRPNDILEIAGDSLRLQGELGWKPEFPIDQTIHDFIELESR